MGSSRSLLTPSAPASSASTSRIREKPKDKWANYSSAKDLGFDDEETQKSAYEIEQELKGRAGEVGAWEEVVEQAPTLYEDTVQNDEVKRKFEEDEEDHESFKIRDKRVRDVYDDQDWDPKRVLGGLKLKVKEEKTGRAVQEPEPATGLDRNGWSGKLELGMEAVESNVDVAKKERPSAEVTDSLEAESAKAITEAEPVKPAEANSLFKKRRSRK